MGKKSDDLDPKLIFFRGVNPPIGEGGYLRREMVTYSYEYQSPGGHTNPTALVILPFSLL